jgi:probable HAF family extracellular repeat protein
MKRSIGRAMFVIAFAGFATLAEAQRAPPHYTVINLGSLQNSGFSNGYGGVTDKGWVSGDSFLAGDRTEHAFVWRDGVMTDLGALGGANSSTPWPQKNSFGLIVGQAQGSLPDPLGENWGAAYGCNTQSGICDGNQNVQLGFRWQNGVMRALPTLGGNNSTATGANNLGQVAGWDETATVEPAGVCAPPQVLEIKAVVYEPTGKIRKLPTFPGDHLAAAFGINDNGDVVGTSGTCGTPDNPALGVHAVVWRNGAVFNLGGLGGVMNNVALVINNAGQIAGISDLSGDTNPTPECADVPGTRAVLWQNGAIINLGTLPRDCLSSASDINARGQVVGVSCDDSFSCRAFLWDHGVMIDLKSLIPLSSPLYLTYAGGINDLGEIAGTAFDPSTGDAPAFLAIPAPAAQIAGDSVKKMMLPANVRASLQRRLRLRPIGGRTTAQQ